MITAGHLTCLRCLAYVADGSLVRYKFQLPRGSWSSCRFAKQLTAPIHHLHGPIGYKGIPMTVQHLSHNPPASCLYKLTSSMAGSRVAGGIASPTRIANSTALGTRVPTAIAAGSRVIVRAMASADSCPKAALLVIGNEILNGSITDANTPWLAKLLYSQGVDLIRVEYVPDDRDDIIGSVLRMQERVGPQGFVFTSGGIGPTHDDITYDSIAAAAGVPLEVHEPTVAKMKAYYSSKGTELNDARLRMATIPAGAEVLDTPEHWVPLVNINSIYILPGIPRLFQSMISAHKGRFRGPDHHKCEVYTQLPEGDLAAPLTEVAKKFPLVQIGSYPNCDPADERFKVKLTLESRDVETLEAALKAVEGIIPTFAM